MGKMYYSCAILHLLIMEFAICSCFATNTTSFGCISGERKTLLQFKATLTDPSNRLSSWNDTKDCCSWKGVVCDKISRRVISLHLANENPIYPQFGDDSSFDNRLSSNHLDSSLLGLKYLRYLDLSWSNFQTSPIPAFVGSMNQLQHLNLSNANFSGVVPHSLGNLSNLHVLDLNYEYEPYDILMVDDLMWASNLSMLEHLGMSYVDLSGAKHLSEVLFHMLPSILVLRLSNSFLNDTHLPHSCLNSSLLTNIQHLDLSTNSFDGEFPCFLHNMSSLRVLDLSENYYNSSSPHALLRLRNLVHLNLYSNSLHHKADWISEFLFDKCHLKSMNLASNRFYGEVTGRLFRNLSMGYCWTHKLETLDLSHNQFHGHLPEEMGEFKQLNHLDLSDNAFTGPIPTSIGKLRALRYLLLSNNQLSGEIPISLGQLSNLEMIDISSNSFTSTLSEAHFANLSKLKYIWASNNFINFSVGFDWVPPFQLKDFNIRSNRIGDGQFPQWLQTQKALEALFMSNCSISGTLPEWLHYLNLTGLDLSHNMMNGSIPKLPPYLESLRLSHNQIEGPIPKFDTTLDFIDLSDNMMNGLIPDSLCQLKALVYLDLSRNHFSGNLPNCWANLQELNYLRLSSNELSGVMPKSLGQCHNLQGLHLNNNSLTGQLPHTLRNCTELVLLDVGENQLIGDLPVWIGISFPGLKVLRLRNNELYGVIPFTFCELATLQVLDLANNKLTGDIPHCFGNLSGMGKGYINDPFYSYWDGVTLNQVMKGEELEYTTTSSFVVNLDLSNNSLVGEIPPQLTNLSALVGLNLSHNHLGGKIPEKIGDMKSLNSLDLSNNKLFGRMPGSLSGLTFLEHLNLSHNNLSGPIPTGYQLQTLEDPSIYDGNPGLCGAQLQKKCGDDEASKSPNVDENDGGEEEEDDRNDKIIFYGVIVSGFATGFWGIIGVLVLKRSWRIAFFQFAEGVIRKMLGL